MHQYLESGVGIAGYAIVGTQETVWLATNKTNTFWGAKYCRAPRDTAEVLRSEDIHVSS